jgi:hypothetical protein
MLARVDAENLFMSKFFGSITDQTDNADMGDTMLKDGWEGVEREGGRAGGRAGERERGKTCTNVDCRMV